MSKPTPWALYVLRYTERVLDVLREQHGDLYYNNDTFRDNPAFRPFVIEDYGAMLNAAAACGRDPAVVADDIAKIEEEAEEIRRQEARRKRQAPAPRD